MENLKLSAEEKEYEKNKITPGKIATKAATATCDQHELDDDSAGKLQWSMVLSD